MEGRTAIIISVIFLGDQLELAWVGDTFQTTTHIPMQQQAKDNGGFPSVTKNVYYFADFKLC